MAFKVYIIADAEDDILDIYRFVARNDSPQKADKLLSGIEDICKRLSGMPERGHIPPELERIGIYEYREVHYKPYWIIYRISGDSVFVHNVLDGRRNLSELLGKRLLR
jgi:toxin ParE1/3/4